MNYESFSKNYDAMERIAEQGRYQELLPIQERELEDIVLVFATLTPDELKAHLARKIDQLEVSLRTAKSSLLEVDDLFMAAS
jgi:hypothetical protein